MSLLFDNCRHCTGHASCELQPLLHPKVEVALLSLYEQVALTQLFYLVEFASLEQVSFVALMM